MAACLAACKARLLLCAQAQRRKKEIEKRLGRSVNTDGNYEDVSRLSCGNEWVPVLLLLAMCLLAPCRVPCSPRGWCPAINSPQIIANEVVNPDHSTVRLTDVGGLDHRIEDLVSRPAATRLPATSTSCAQRAGCGTQRVWMWQCVMVVLRAWVVWDSALQRGMCT